ncbi:MAG TPA: hypothetical protein VFT94_08645, partial [Gaiellaceae bacterium]|nr:hypothetical protein [Gaiellaceae bacterium]
MKIALTLVLGESKDGLGDFLRFHRDAGVDVVVVGGASAAEALEPYLRAGFVRLVERGVSQSELACVAANELGAEWVIPGALEEVWWPRGESLKDVLAVIPPRYGVVQGLLRTFVGATEQSEAGSSVFASRTVRTSLLGPDGSDGASPTEL